MKDEDKTKEQFIKELAGLRQRITELDKSEIERKRAEEEIKQRNRELEALLEVSQHLAGWLDLDELMDAIARAIVETLPTAEAASLWLYDEQRNELVIRAWAGHDDEAISGLALSPDTSLVGLVYRSRQPQIIDDVASEPAFQLLGRPALDTVRSVLGVPLLVEGQPIGALFADNFSRTHVFGEDDLRLLQSLASQAVIAIQNARLYQEAQRELAERKRAEEALQESEERLRNLFATMAEGVVVIAPDGQIIQANPVAERILGLKHSKIEGRNYVGPEWEIFRPDGTPMPAEEMAGPRAMKERRPVKNVVMSVKHPDGSISWINVNAAPLINEAGRLEGVVSTFVDITDLKRAEDALRRRAAQLEALREVGLEIIAQLDLEALLQSIVSRAIALLGGASGGLYLYRPERDVLEWVMAVGPNLAPIGTVLHRGEGLSGKVLETGEPLIADDYQHWEGRAAVYEGYPFGAVVGAPVRLGEEFLGVVNVAADPARTFSPADVELLSLFATQVAIAIRNARLYEAEQKRRHIAETLRQASTVLSSTLELDEVLKLILQQLRQVIPYDTISVQLLQDEHLEIVTCQGFKKPDKVVGLAFSLDPKFPNYHVVTTKAPLAIEDVVQDYPHFKDEADTYESGRIRSWLGVPLMVKGQVIGMVALDRVEVRPYTAEETQLAMAFANQAAMAIENARLYEAAQRELAERKRAEEEVHRLNQFLESIIDNANVWLHVFDEKANVLIWNKAAEEISGYSRDEVVGHNKIWEWLYPDEEYRNKVLAEAMAIIEKGGEEKGAETTIQCKDGQTKIISWNSRNLVDEKGTPIGSIALGHDITERKRMEEELRKASKLESVGILAGGIAHDFNNILTAVIGNISFAKRYTSPGDELWEILKAAEKASLRARDLTKQLLTFARGGAPIKKKASLAELIKDAVSFALRGSNVRCQFSIPDDLWPVEIDLGQISRVINNLVINADQAMPEGGIIKVRAENTTLGVEDSLPLREGRYVKVSIEDQGGGIPKEHLPKIFDPYFTTKQKGSGLGLAISYSIIKNHDGHITVESELGMGTTFSLYLPASEKEILTRKEEEEEKPLVGRGKILVMDDEELVRETAGGMLSHLGYEVEFAQDGAEAIELYEQAKESGRPFDAVIVDLTVRGGMGGKETVQKLLEIDPEVKAIVSSGYSTDPIMADFREYGFSGVVAKPYKIEELSEVLYKVICVL